MIIKRVWISAKGTYPAQLSASILTVGTFADTLNHKWETD